MPRDDFHDYHFNFTAANNMSHHQPLETLLEELASSEYGLSDQEAMLRLRQNGPNRIHTESSINPLLIFIGQFKNFIIYILLFAVFFSLLIQEYVDSLIILIILVINSLIGFFQELSAEKSLESLKKISKTTARVFRGGSMRIIDGEELVAGDVIFLEAGDKVPADARVMRTTRLKAEEATLTGESVPTDKVPGIIAREAPLGDRSNMLFSSTNVVAGNCHAVVTATGMATEIGKITELLSQSDKKLTPLQLRLENFGKKLGIAIIFICIFIFSVCLGKEYFNGALSSSLFISLAFIAISLAVAAVPTALPAVVTIALSIGVKRLLKKKALVRKLSAVETLGSCDIICTDKTGTLTQNQMTVRFAWTPDGEATLSGNGYDPEGNLSTPLAPLLFDIGRCCNNAGLRQDKESWSITGDPTEGALLVSGMKAGLPPGIREENIIDQLPFDSERKRMSVLIQRDDELITYTKGATDSLLDCCTHYLTMGKIEPLATDIRRTIRQRVDHYSDQALRVLAFAYKPIETSRDFREEELIFVGLQAMMDPPRPEVLDSIAKTHGAGIRVIMITGDYIATAKAIGAEIGIHGKALSGEKLAGMTMEEVINALRDKVNIFARVAPVDKQRIVEGLQSMGHTVAMTGDGVNDAPALKKADIGVAVGSGTDVAKEAADFVLLDDSFTHIANAIEEGRGIYDNIQKSIMLLLSGNLGEVLIIFIAVLLGMDLPLTAILLLWINMITDGAPALAYSVDPYGRGIMSRPPKPKDEGILPRPKLALIGAMGLIGTIIALFIFNRYQNGTGGGDLLRAQTMVFNFVVLYELILTLVIRLDYRVPLLANAWIWAAVSLSLVLQALLMYTDLHVVFKIVPLTMQDLVILFISGLCFFTSCLTYRYVQRISGPGQKGFNNR